jgi:hypothetical protein
MAKYTGNISLIDMSDITATAGVGIEKTEVKYAVSTSVSETPINWEENIPEVEGG